MKKRTLGAVASVLGSFLVVVSGSACQVTLGKDDGTGGQSTTDSGGSDALGGSASTAGGRPDSSTGGVAEGGSSSAQGGSTSTQGGSTSAQGGSASAKGGSAGAQGGSMPSGGSVSVTGGSTGDPGTPYTEECGAPEPADNNDRDTAVALGSGATLCLNDPNDDDWFYVDTPADGKGHILQLDFDQEPGAWTYIDIYAKTDGSRIDYFHLDKGVKSTIFVTLGPGARTLFDFSAYSSSNARTFIKATLTAENDTFEPNNERDAAAAIKPGQKISAQMLTPYVSAQQYESADWFKVELAAGDHVFHLTAVPQETWLKISISDNARVNVDWDAPPNRGAIFDFPFTAPGAGTYFFAVESYSTLPPVVTGSPKAHFLGESYTFQID